MHGSKAPRTVPDLFTVYKNHQWNWWSAADFAAPGNWGPKGKNNLDRAGVEEWKNHFYKVEGWDNKHGWPTDITLQRLNLGNVAEKLKAAGKIGDPY
jgi:aldehyde:ferredoxin oxidoreductase